MIFPSRELMPIIRAALERGQRVRMSISGSSMLPFLRDGDLVELEPAALPRLGDMVLTQTNIPGTKERYLLHRIVRLEKGRFFYLRGDAQTNTEGPFRVDTILGRVIVVWRNGYSRQTDHGFWRWTGLFWMRTFPVGNWILWLFLRLRRLFGAVLLVLQRFSALRVVIKRFRPPYTIFEASQGELLARVTGIEADYGTSSTTNYLALNGDKLLGFVRLMRYAEDGYPFKGYWLYSLTVRSLKRGMGIGENLVRHAVRQAHREGAQEIFTWTYEDNEASMALFVKLGFHSFENPELKAALNSVVKQDERHRITFYKNLAAES